MTTAAVRFWAQVHKWSSLLCTAFLLMLCTTGLPLIFHDEVEALTGEDQEAALGGTASALAGRPLDAMLAQAMAGRPGQVPLFMAFSQDSSLLTVTLGPSPDAEEQDMTLLFLDRATGKPLGPAPQGGVMDVLLQVHTDMFLGLPGMIFLGVMGLLFIVSLLSGLVLYALFMRKLPFGAVRMDRAKRTGRLDQHNLLGITALAWMLVVGATGAINAFADPVVDNWRNGELAQMTAEFASAGALAPSQYGSIDRALSVAKAALPGRSPQFIAFPGGDWSTAHHYAVFFQGDTPATQYLLTPALVDAKSLGLTASRDLPPLAQALMLSKPLHFGDYGGLPLKIIWALLDLATIWVLWTGILLWLRRDKQRAFPRRSAVA